VTWSKTTKSTVVVEEVVEAPGSKDWVGQHFHLIWYNFLFDKKSKTFFPFFLNDKKVDFFFFFVK
jgi:hypothetical protein